MEATVEAHASGLFHAAILYARPHAGDRRDHDLRLSH
jgi:hypothetical protein